MKNDALRSIQQLIDEMQLKAKRGIELHKYQVLCALRLEQFQKALARVLNDGGRIDDIVRVYYTQNSDLIEVLARVKTSNISLGSRGILVTLRARDMTFASMQEDFEEPENLRPEGVTFLPLVMALPSAAEQMSTSENDLQFAQVTDRRNEFTRQLVAENIDAAILLGTPTNCQSCNQTSWSSPYGTSAPTTNHAKDQDSITDYRTDSGAECVTDVGDDNRP